MKKLWIFGSLLLFGVAGTAVYVSDQRCDIREDAKPKVVHVYLDNATTPTFLQMVDMVANSDFDEKIVLWNRHQDDVPADLVQKYNIHFIYPTLREKITFYWERFQKYVDNLVSAYPVKRGIAYYEANLPVTLSRRIKEYMALYTKRNPEAKFVFHVNYDHAWRLLSYMLFELPENKIEKVYFYEDGTAWFAQYYLNKRIYPKLMKLVDIVSAKYPVFFKVTYSDVEKNGVSLKDFLQQNYKMTVLPIDYKMFASTLSFDQKRELLRFFNVEYGALESLFKDQKTLLLLTPPFFFIQGAEFDIFDAVGDNITFDSVVFKPHPTKEDTKAALRPILKKHPQMKIMPKQLPFEALVLLDMIPQYVMGITSSCFFSVPPDNIYKYIVNSPDSYKDTLLTLGILTPEKVVELSDLQKENEGLGK